MGTNTQFQHEELYTYGVAPETIDFYLNTPGGTGDLTFGAGCPKGMFTSAKHIGTGKYTVTMAFSVVKVIGYEATVDDISSPDFSRATLGPFSNEGTTTALAFTLNTVTANTATDLAASRKIRIKLRVQRSSWGKMT